MPSRTPSNYVLFSIDYRKKVIEKSPELSLGQVSRECGNAWKALSEAEKKPWNDKASELKAARKAEIDKQAELNPPKKKRTPSSYLIFSVAQRPQILNENPSFTIGQISKLCGEKWRSMSKEEQQPWIDEAKALKEKN